MSKNNLILSISYLEMVNKITSVFNKLLYDPLDGYYNFKSKEAILAYTTMISKFDYEASKLLQEYDFENKNEILKNKKDNFINMLKKHFVSQIPIWADEVFEDCIENYLLELSLDKEKFNSILNQVKEIILWIAKIKKLNDFEIEALQKKYASLLLGVLNSDDNDFLKTNILDKSDEKKFLEIWNMINLDLDEFLKLNFSEFRDKLANFDIRFFEKIKSKLNTNKKNSVLDEIEMILASIKLAKLCEDKEIYKFIKTIYADFDSFCEQNKTISEQDKLVILKKRIDLSLESDKKIKKYYIEKLTSLGC